MQLILTDIPEDIKEICQKVARAFNDAYNKDSRLDQIRKIKTLIPDIKDLFTESSREQFICFIDTLHETQIKKDTNDVPIEEVKKSFHAFCTLLLMELDTILPFVVYEAVLFPGISRMIYPPPEARKYLPHSVPIPGEEYY